MRLITTKDTSYQLQFGGWYLIQIQYINKDTSAGKEKWKRLWPCFPTDKQGEALEEILGSGFCEQCSWLTLVTKQTRSPCTASLCFSVTVTARFLIWTRKPSSHSTAQASLKANLHCKRILLSLIPQIKLTRALEAIRLASRIQNGKEYCAVGSKVAFQISSQNWYLEYHVK